MLKTWTRDDSGQNSTLTQHSTWFILPSNHNVGISFKTWNETFDELPLKSIRIIVVANVERNVLLKRKYVVPENVVTPNIRTSITSSQPAVNKKENYVETSTKIFRLWLYSRNCYDIHCVNNNPSVAILKKQDFGNPSCSHVFTTTTLPELLVSQIEPRPSSPRLTQWNLYSLLRRLGTICVTKYFGKYFRMVVQEISEVWSVSRFFLQ